MSERDLYALLKEHASSDEVLGKLWNQVSTVPDWVDWDQIARGQRVVYQYHGQMLSGVCSQENHYCSSVYPHRGPDLYVPTSKFYGL